MKYPQKYERQGEFDDIMLRFCFAVFNQKQQTDGQRDSPSLSLRRVTSEYTKTTEV